VAPAAVSVPSVVGLPYVDDFLGVPGLACMSTVAVADIPLSGIMLLLVSKYQIYASQIQETELDLYIYRTISYQT
jgi:hypothetical protein